ncbi:MAG: ABC transporter substrate-binding protein [Saprospiraceae bacterium]
MTNVRVNLSLFFFSTLFIFSCHPDAGVAWKHNDNTVRVRTNADIQTVNPYLTSAAWARTANEMMYQYPMDFDPETLELVPQLVKAPVTTEPITEGEFAGGEKFNFEILDEAVWDDGQPVTGHDYEFSLKTLFNPKLPLQNYATYFEFIKDIQIDPSNPKKFTVFANQQFMLNYGAVTNVTMLPEHLFDPDGLTKGISFKELADPATAAKYAEDERIVKFAALFQSPEYGREKVSGSGPYQLGDWVEGQRIVLVKKKNWWGDKLAGQYKMLRAFPDTIIYLPIEDQTAAITALKAEDYDVGFDLDVKQFLEVRNDSFLSDIYNFFTPPRFAFYYTAMQNRNPKLADKKVRQAMARLIDMDAFIRDVMDGMGERVVGPILPDKKYYNKKLQLIPLDLDGARRLLAEAGWADSDGNGILDKMVDGQRLELKLEFLVTPGSPLQENFSEIFKNNAKKVGIEVEKVAVESNVLRQRMRNGDYEISAGLGAGVIPLLDDLKQLYHTDSAQPGGSNYTRFSNPEADAMIDEIRITTDEKRRDELYLKLQEIIYDEQPMIFLFSPLSRIVVHKRFDTIVSRKSPGVSLQHLKLKQ